MDLFLIGGNMNVDILTKNRKSLEDLELKCIVMKPRSIGWTELAISNMASFTLDGVGLTLSECAAVYKVIGKEKHV